LGWGADLLRVIAGGVELDDDRDRVDLDAVHHFLSEEAYWVLGRSRETIQRLVRESTRVIGAYDGKRQVGFCRVMSDGSNMAWLGDVYVESEYRGRGIGVELVREAFDHPDHRELFWYLSTHDAQELYKKFGFQPATERTMVRPRPPD
jgi:ribosomal protein S18 acetylase RimI-like enzyme